jgi:hypothetical protein
MSACFSRSTSAAFSAVIFASSIAVIRSWSINSSSIDIESRSLCFTTVSNHATIIMDRYLEWKAPTIKANTLSIKAYTLSTGCSARGTPVFLRDLEERQTAIGCLIGAAEGRDLMMHARIGVSRAMGPEQPRDTGDGQPGCKKIPPNALTEHGGLP